VLMSLPVYVFASVFFVRKRSTNHTLLLRIKLLRAKLLSVKLLCVKCLQKSISISILQTS